MRKYLLIGIICQFCLISVFSQSKKTWEKTRRENTYYGYRNFILKYPNSSYADSAKIIFADMEIQNDLKQAIFWNSKDALCKFIDKYPNSKYRIQAEKAITEIRIQDSLSFKKYEIDPEFKNPYKKEITLNRSVSDDNYYSNSIYDLKKIGNKAVPFLVQHLNDDNPRYRDLSVFCLGEIKDLRAVNPLVKVLKDKCWVVREDAAKALDKLEYKPLSKDENIVYLIAKRQFEELVKFGDSATNYLSDYLSDQNLETRMNTVITLDKIGWKPSNVDENIAYLLAKLGWNPETEKYYADHHITGTSKHDELALGKLDDVVKFGQPAIKPLIACLNYDDYEFNSLGNYIVDALVKIGKPAVQPLITCLNDSNEYMRHSAIFALGSIGDSIAIKPLIASLKDKKNVEVAAKALDKLDAYEAYKPLIACLNENICPGVIKAVSKFGEKDVIPYLVSVLPNWDYINLICKELKRLGWNPVTEQDKVYNWIGTNDTISLNSISNKEQIRRVLIADLYSVDNKIKAKFALNTFIKLGIIEVIDDLIYILNTRNEVEYATTFLNCGNIDLSKAAEIWAKKHGYYISSLGGIRSEANWGKW